MDFGLGFVDTTLFNGPFTPNKSIVDEYNVAYTTGFTPNPQMWLTTQAQNVLGYDPSMTTNIFKLYPARIVATPEILGGTIEMSTFTVKIFQTCNKAEDDLNGPALVLAAPTASLLT